MVKIDQPEFLTGFGITVNAVNGFINNGTTAVSGMATFNADNTIGGTFSAVGLTNNAALAVGAADVTGLTGTYTGNAGSSFTATGKDTGFTTINLSTGTNVFNAKSVGTLTFYSDAADSSFTVADAVTLNNDTTINGTFSSGVLTTNWNTTVTGTLTATGLTNSAEFTATGATALNLTGTFTGNTYSMFDANGKATGFTAIDLSAFNSKFFAQSTGTLTSLDMSSTSWYSQGSDFDMSGVGGTIAAGARIQVDGDLTNARLNDGIIYNAFTMSDLDGETISSSTSVVLSDATAVTLGTGVTLADTARLTFTDADVTLGSFTGAAGTELVLQNGGLTLNGNGSVLGLLQAETLTIDGDLNGLGRVITTSGTTLQSGSRLAPGGTGDPTGTLTLEGGLTLDATTLVIDTSSTGASSFDVSGGLVLTGANRIALNSLTKGTFTIIQSDETVDYLNAANGFSNDRIDGLSGRWRASLEQQGNDLFLNLLLGQEYAVLARSMGAGRNLVNVGSLLDALPDTDPLRIMLDNLATDAAAFAAMNPLRSGGEAVLGGLRAVQFDPWRFAFVELDRNEAYAAHNASANTYRGQQCDTAAAQRLRTWFQAYGYAHDIDNDGNALDYDADRIGGLLGLDRRVSQNCVFGAMFGYADVKAKNDYARTEANDYTFALYARSRFSSKIHLNAFLGYGRQDYDYSRWLGGNHFTADYNGNAAYASLELVRPFRLNRCSTLLPLFAIDYQQAWADDFNDGQMLYDKTDLLAVVARFGLNGTFNWNGNHGLGRGLRTRLQYGWQFAGDTDGSVATAFVSNPAMSAPIYGNDLGQHYLDAGIGYQHYVGKGAYLFADYDFGLGENRLSHLGQVGLAVAF